MTREEAKRVYFAHIEEEPEASANVRRCHERLNRALDSYVAEICIDMFHFAYELGFEAGKAGARE